MEINNVFQENQEIDRLTVQNQLLKDYEQPVYDRVLSQYKHPVLLDVGCNNGYKVFDRFCSTHVARVIGLEFHRDLAEQAQAHYGNEVFSFHQCDVERADFAERLTLLMAQNEVEGFDVIHASFVLMHLKNPQALLKTLRQFLAPGGSLVVVEADDSKGEISPDPDNLLGQFLDILRQDAFSGDRLCGSRVPGLLAQAGYRQIKLENECIRAGRTEPQKKQILFDIFFPYLLDDVRLLQEQSPDDTRYDLWAQWLETHLDALRDSILAEDAQVSVGVTIVTCFGGSV